MSVKIEKDVKTKTEKWKKSQKNRLKEEQKWKQEEEDEEGGYLEESDYYSEEEDDEWRAYDSQARNPEFRRTWKYAG